MTRNSMAAFPLCLALACGGEGGGGSISDGSNPPATGDPGPGEYQEGYQTSSEFFTRMSQPALGPTHRMMRIWYSTNVEELPPGGPFTVPEGTVAIKAEFDASGENFLTVVMVKREAGYDAANGNWYYEGRLPDGSLASDPTPGPAPLCVGCHDDSPDTDYLRGFDIEN